MNAYWVKFEDGSSGSCEGQGSYDALKIAEHVSGKKVKAKPGHEGAAGWDPTTTHEIHLLPYPATPVIWQFEHPVHGACPTFCHSPHQCRGKSACPQRYACSE